MGDLVTWLSTTPEQRQHGRNLEAIDRDTGLAITKVVGINRVKDSALIETMRTEMVRQQAERLAPDGRELYAMIAVTGAVESARIIEGLGRRWSR